MKKYNKILYLLNFLVLVTIFNSCIKYETVPIEVEPPVKPNEWINNPYKLNVVYFVPSDLDTIAGYKQRISKILLEAQKFFADNMQREGFGRKSFGLDLLNDTTVNIITIKSAYPKSDYPYSGAQGYQNVRYDAEEYYKNNNLTKTSLHTLYILPLYNNNHNAPSGGPFFGIGRDCFALDFNYLDQKYLGTGGTIGDLATKWIGGMIHELGHGLNVPHDRVRKTLRPQLGTSLMGEGNLTYGKSTTSVTDGSCAILNSSQTFSTVNRSNFYQSATFSLKSLSASYVDNAIVVTGSYTTTIPVENIGFWHDPSPYGSNNDYDAPSWVGTNNNLDNTFEVKCNLADFDKLTGAYQMRIKFILENGAAVNLSYNYTFDATGIPQLGTIKL